MAISVDERFLSYGTAFADFLVDGSHLSVFAAVPGFSDVLALVVLDHVNKVGSYAVEVLLLKLCKAGCKLLLLFSIQGLEAHSENVRGVMKTEALALPEGLAELRVLSPEVWDCEAVAVYHFLLNTKLRMSHSWYNLSYNY